MFLHEITSRRRRNRFRLFVSGILIGLGAVLFFGAAEGRAGEVIYVRPGNGGATDPVFENSKSGFFVDEDVPYDPDMITNGQTNDPVGGYGVADPVHVWGPDSWPGTSGTYAHPKASLFPWLYGEGNTVTVDGVSFKHSNAAGDVKGYVLGGFWQGQTHGANSNTVNIVNGADVGKVYGGAAIGDTKGNIVYVTGGNGKTTKATQVTGGLSVQQVDEYGVPIGQLPGYGYVVENNKVYLSGGSGGVSVNGFVSGGWNASGERGGSGPEVEDADTIVRGNWVEIGAGVAIEGNSTHQANVYGGYNEGNSKTYNNTVRITGGTITHSSGTNVRMIAGAFNSVIASSDKAEVYGNRVLIEGGTIDLKVGGNYTGIYGGRSQGGSVNVHDNEVIISGGEIDTKVVTGGSGGQDNTQNSQVYSNGVTITGEETIVTGNIAGGRVNDAGTARENSVTLGGGTVTGNVYGAYDGIEATRGAAITNNRVDFVRGIVTGDIHGGKADAGNAEGNTVHLYGGSLTGDAYGGSADAGSATGNAVNLRGMTVDGDLYGGAAATAADATQNSVNLYGGTVTKHVYGNNDADPWDPANGWAVANNRLNAFSGVTHVGGIDRFQEAAVYGGANVNVTGAAASSAIFNNLENNGLLSFHNDSLNQDVGRINGGYSGNGQIGLEVKFNKGANPAETDSVVFGSAPAANVVFTFKPAGGSEAAGYANSYANSLFAKTDSGDLVYSTLEPGYGFYSYIFRENDAGAGKKEYFVGLTDADIPERGNVLTDGSATRLTQVALLADTFLRTGLEQAVASICCPNRGWGISASAGYATHRIGTGGDGHADLRGFTGQVALAYNRKGTPFNVGLFGEMFDGTYRTADTVSLTSGVFDQNARGDLESYGGGLFFQYRRRLAEAVESGTAPEWIPGPHLEAVVHAGWSVMDFAMAGGDGSSFRHDDKGTPYYGASLGGGYVVDAFPGIIADLYGHGRWVRQGAQSAAGNVGESIEIDAADSLRLVAGVRAASRSDGIVRPYAGLAAEWEALGETGARIDGHEAKRADVSGVSGLIELGVGVRARDCVYADLKAFASIGKRRGIGGVLEVMYAF